MTEQLKLEVGKEYILPGYLNNPYRYIGSNVLIGNNGKPLEIMEHELKVLRNTRVYE